MICIYYFDMWRTRRTCVHNSYTRRYLRIYSSILHGRKKINTTQHADKCSVRRGYHSYTSTTSYDLLLLPIMIFILFYNNKLQLVLRTRGALVWCSCALTSNLRIVKIRVVFVDVWAVVELEWSSFRDIISTCTSNDGCCVYRAMRDDAIFLLFVQTRNGNRRWSYLNGGKLCHRRRHNVEKPIGSRWSLKRVIKLCTKSAFLVFIILLKYTFCRWCDEYRFIIRTAIYCDLNQIQCTNYAISKRIVCVCVLYKGR